MGNFDEERNEYKNKVGRQNEVIANILDLSDRHSGLFDYAMIKQLKAYRSKCNKLYNKLEKNEFEIAIVGLEKAGKSTFGNALMENRILPDADERCTYTSTCIRYGNDRAVVKFFNSAEMDSVLRGYLETIGVENIETYTYQSLTESDYRIIFNKLQSKDRYENTVHQDILNILENKKEIISQYMGQSDRIFEGEDLYSDELKSYIVSPKVAVAVKEVSIESSKLGKLQNAVIYDVPGFDSPTRMHLDQTKERMKEADAIILIASAEKPSFTAPALDMFQKVVDEDNVSLSDKLFIFGNRADAANTLGKNINTLKKEVDKWKLLSKQQIEERLIIGSAKAHLQKMGIVEGDYCIKRIEEDEEYKNVWKHGDGIQYAYDKLVNYNETERFAVIKKKIKKNDEELRTIFKELKEKYSDDGFDDDHMPMLSGTMNLSRDAKSTIQNELEEIREEIRNKYNKELVLSKRLQDEVLKLFDDKEKYAINQEDIENAHKKNDDISGSVNIEKVEEIIREEKFNLIYNDFSMSAFSVAQNDHSEYYQRIVSVFESALNVNVRGNDYNTLHKVITDFIGNYKKNYEDDFIYQSVIERFVRDIVEVLIRRPYSSEARLSKFIDEAEVFSGLVMFYNPGDANDGYKRKFLSVAPKNQPLLLALVFHEYRESYESGKSAMNYISNINKSLSENSEVVDLVFSIIKKDPIGGIDAIRRMVNKDDYRDCKSDDDYIRKTVRELYKTEDSYKREEKSKIKEFNFDFSNAALFERQYKQFFGNQEVRTYDKVCEFFRVDLEILEKFLIHASIPAIRLEKPFVSREVQSINKLLEAVNSKEFDDLIIDNSKLFLPLIYENLKMARANSMANKAALDEVEKILKTLDVIEAV